MKKLINALSDISLDYIDELKGVACMGVKKRRFTKMFWLYTSVIVTTVSVGAYIAIASNTSGAHEFSDISSDSIYSSSVTTEESFEMIESDDESSENVIVDTSSDESLNSDVSNESSPNEDDVDIFGSLVVNGEEVMHATVIIHDDYAEVPFVATMEALGASFEWESDTVAWMLYNVRSPIKLNIQNGLLCYNGDDTNLLEYCGDSSLSYTTLKKEILVDSNNFKAFLSENSYSVEYFDVDFNEKVVSISRDMKDYSCTLIVNGNDITKESRAVMKRDDGRYFLLPIVAILEELGADFEWKSETLSYFRFDDSEFVLDISKCELYRKDEDINLIASPPGGVRKHRRLEKELLLDDLVLTYFFKEIKVNSECDYGDKVVRLTMDNTLVIDPQSIVYNPNSIHHTRFYEIEGFESGVVGTPDEYLNEVEFDNDVYFCIELIDYYDQTFTDEELGLNLYLKSIGFVVDEGLTEKFCADSIADCTKVVGYVNVETWKKLVEDNFKIQYNWLTETCAKGQCAYHYFKS